MCSYLVVDYLYIIAYVLISGGGLYISSIAYMLISGGGLNSSLICSYLVDYIYNSSLMCSYLVDYIYKLLHIWWIIYIIHRLCAHIWWWTIYIIHGIYAHIWWTLRIDRLQQAQSICQRCEWKEEKP